MDRLVETSTNFRRVPRTVQIDGMKLMWYTPSDEAEILRRGLGVPGGDANETLYGKTHFTVTLMYLGCALKGYNRGSLLIELLGFVTAGEPAAAIEKGEVSALC